MKMILLFTYISGCQTGATNERKRRLLVRESSPTAANINSECLGNEKSILNMWAKGRRYYPKGKEKLVKIYKKQIVA